MVRTPCPQGRYCPVGTGDTTSPCPLGTFGHTTGKFSDISRFWVQSVEHYSSIGTGICLEQILIRDLNQQALDKDGKDKSNRKRLNN